MAIIKDPNDDQQQAGELGSQASSTVSGGAGGMVQGGAAAPGGKSGKFTNLSRYMAANDGNEAVQNSIGDINAKGDQVQQSFSGAKNNFDSLKVDAPKDLAQSDLNYLNTFNPKKFSYSIDANGNAGSPETTNIAAGIAGMQYNGPSTGDIGNTYQNYDKAKSGVDEAGKLFEASPNGVANRQLELSKTNTQRANGNYGGGMAKLDSALVEHQGANVFDPQRQALSNMSGEYMNSNVSQRAGELQNQAKAAQDLADKAQNTYQPQFQMIQNTINNAAAANRHGAFGGGNASANGTFAKPQFGAATPQSIAAANRPTPVPVAAPKPIAQQPTTERRNSTDRVK